jgi:hypothetical protein
MDDEVRGLAVLPEQSPPEGYSLERIENMVQFYRERFAASWIDLTNATPSLGDPAGETVQYWLLNADVVVVSARVGGKAEFEDALEFLDTVGDVPAVVALLGAAGRRLATLPEVRARIEELRTHPATRAMVTIPFDEEVPAATLLDRHLIQASPQILVAYTQLVRAVLTTHRDRRLGPLTIG